MADTCKWMADNEICCNDKCPMCADFCPVPYEPGVCRYEDRDGADMRPDENGQRGENDSG